MMKEQKETFDCKNQQNDGQSRRRFIAGMALLGAGLAVGGLSCDASQNQFSEKNMSNPKLKITFGDKEFIADLEDNATTRALLAKLPLTVPMENLYGREFVYRFPDALPAEEEKTTGYEVGDIIYWSPWHSFAIFYKQDGTVITNFQKIGRIESGVEVLEKIGDTDVKFELLK